MNEGRYDLIQMFKELDDRFEELFNINPRMDLEEMLKEEEELNSGIATNNLKDYLILIDEGIKSIICINEICKKNLSIGKKGLGFVALTSKLVTLSLGMRRLIYSGLGDCVKVLYRPFVETIDIIYACLNNQFLYDAYSNTSEMYDPNDFYYKNLKQNKLEKEYKSLFRKIEMKDELIASLSENRKNMKSFLSESIHASFRSTVANYLMPTIDLTFDDKHYGKITTAFPKLLMAFIEDISFLNQIFFAAIEKKISCHLEDVVIDDLSRHQSKKYLFVYAFMDKELSEKAEILPSFIKEAMDDLAQKQNDFQNNAHTNFPL